MPTIDIPDKVCNKCKIKKLIDCFKYRPRRNNYYSQCKDCMNDYRRINYNQNIEHYREYKKKWKDKIGRHQIYINNNKFTLEWRKNNPKRYRELCNKIYKKYIDNLSDTYLRDLISDCSRSGLKPNEIPQELIELKRKQLLLTRKLKQNDKN
jgi:hypothetical protein